jgi:hypothetical protein
VVNLLLCIIALPSDAPEAEETCESSLAEALKVDTENVDAL